MPVEMSTEIVVQISYNGAPVAQVIYRSGLHVEVRIEDAFKDERIRFKLSHSRNKELVGNWEEALDIYFNDGIFDTKDHVFKGDMRRVGSAREHKSLFRQAAYSLLKDLETHGYDVEVRHA
jgi:hypothetical protein